MTDQQTNTTATTDRSVIIGGVDTHKDTHTVAAITSTGQFLGHATFPATGSGYRQLLAWLQGHGQLGQVGIEGTGSYGAGLARHLTTAGIDLVEVDRPDRKTRRTRGKSDPIDAEAAARAVLARTATGTPKTRTGPAEALRMIHTTRASALKARTAAMNAFQQLLITAPEPLRAQLRGLKGTKLVAAAAKLRPGTNLADPTQTAKRVLRRYAHRIHDLDDEIATSTHELTTLVTQTAPGLLAQFGVGPETAAQLLITAGDNPHRIHTEAAFAALCGTNPIPASSGRTHHHRLNRGGDRQANRALYIITIVRLAHHPTTRDYAHRSTTKGRSKTQTIRCLKRYIA
ncbi:IS110 family transposase, partial [Kribbella sp. NPDC056951]|uniref:IS110 family transposase n=1 Tax=Kribbella sp. NPDC056951 TaxID=3345978 RepID=UPI0036403DC7